MIPQPLAVCKAEAPSRPAGSRKARRPDRSMYDVPMDAPSHPPLSFSDLRGWSESHRALSCALDAIAGSHPACSALSARWPLGGSEPTLLVERPRRARAPASSLPMGEATAERLAEVLKDSAQASSMARLLGRLAPAFAAARRADFDWAQALTSRGDGSLGLAESARFDDAFPDGVEPHSEAAAELLGASCAELAAWAPGLALACLRSAGEFLKEPARGACLALGAEFEADALAAPSLGAGVGPQAPGPKRRL